MQQEQQALNEFLSEVKNLPQEKQTAVASLLGSLIADAATRPLHWVYNREKLESTIGSKDPEFWPENLTPFYTLPTGRYSQYGDIASVMVQALAAQQKYSQQEYENQLQAFYGGETSEYQVALKKRNEYSAMLKEIGKEWDTPVPGPWINKTTLTFLENYKKQTKPTGDDSTKDTDGFCGSMPYLIYESAQTKSVDIEKIIQSVQTINNNAENLNYARTGYRILLKFLQKEFQKDQCGKQQLGDLIKEEKNEAIAQELKDLLLNLEGNHSDYVEKVGKACYNPGNFLGAVHSIFQAKGFEEGVRKSMLAGGNNCARSLFIGAALGAKYGLEALPSSWILKTANYQTLLKQILTIFK